MENELKKCLSTISIDRPYQVHSRVHPLHSFTFPFSSCFVKRDDELGFGITGSKLRKYNSLLPALLKDEIEEVVVIGSAQSNNVLGISQLLIENRIQPTLFLKQPSHTEMKGNLLLTNLLVSDKDIHWIPGSKWNSAEQLAENYKQNNSKKIFILKEGASVTESLPGALTLPVDILKNEQQLNLQFDHIFVESGTGLMAIALILGYAWMQKTTTIHVLLLAGDDFYFLNQLTFFHRAFEKLVSSSIPIPNNFVLHQPKQCKSFGSTNSSIFKEIRFVARMEGFFIDPIYTAKLFIETRRILCEDPLTGNILINHSGGGLSLFGFHDRLSG